MLQRRSVPFFISMKPTESLEHPPAEALPPLEGQGLDTTMYQLSVIAIALLLLMST